MRTLALPEVVEHWSLTTLREKLVKIGARIVRHGRYVVFQLAEVAVPRALFASILRRIRKLALCGKPTHHHRSGSGIWEIPAQTAALRSPTGRPDPSRVFGGLPYAANRRIFGVQQPGSGESQLLGGTDSARARARGIGRWDRQCSLRVRRPSSGP